MGAAVCAVGSASYLPSKKFYPPLLMESFVGTTGWYIMLLVLGLLTGAVIQWVRRNRDDA